MISTTSILLSPSLYFCIVLLFVVTTCPHHQYKLLISRSNTNILFINAQSSSSSTTTNLCPAPSSSTDCDHCVSWCQASMPSYICRVPTEVSSANRWYVGRDALCANTLTECQRLCFAPEYCIPTNYAQHKPYAVQHEICRSTSSADSFNRCPRLGGRSTDRTRATTCGVCQSCFLKSVNNAGNSNYLPPYYYCAELSTCYLEKPYFSYTDWLKYNCFEIPAFSTESDRCALHVKKTTWEDYHNSPPSSNTNNDNIGGENSHWIWIGVIVLIAVSIFSCVVYIRKKAKRDLRDEESRMMRFGRVPGSSFAYELEELDRDRERDHEREAESRRPVHVAMLVAAPPLGDDCDDHRRHRTPSASTKTPRGPMRTPRDFHGEGAAAAAREKKPPEVVVIRGKHIPITKRSKLEKIDPPRRNSHNHDKAIDAIKRDLADDDDEDDEILRIANRAIEKNKNNNKKNSNKDDDNGNNLHAVESLDLPVQLPADLPFGSPRNDDDEI